MILKNITEMLKGILEGCVLEIIGQAPTYGYEITQKLKASGFEDILEGTVYTITVRLEKQQLVDVKRQNSSSGPPRKLFKLNKAGQAKRREFWDSFYFITEKCDELYKKGRDLI